MEVTSTGDFISRVDTINKTDIPIEEIDLEEIDEHLEKQANEAQERYDNFDSDQLDGWKEGQDQENLPGGWKAEEIGNTQNDEDVPKGWKDVNIEDMVGEAGVHTPTTSKRKRDGNYG